MEVTRGHDLEICMIDVEVDAVLVGQIAPLGQRKVPSGIDKRPVVDRIPFNEVGFLHDEQGDKRVHGGPEKALHHYPFDHYAFWRDRLFDEKGTFAGKGLQTPGFLGENISTNGVVESDVCLGDVFQLGTGVVQISQGRQPCWKLNERFGVNTMARLVQSSGFTGWYYRVLDPGEVGPGDQLTLVERLAPEWPLSKVMQLLYVKTTDLAALECLVELPFLAESWRRLMERRLARGQVEDWTSRLEGG